MTKEDVTIERLGNLEREIKKIALSSELGMKQRNLECEILKQILDTLREIEKSSDRTADNTAYLKSFDSAICDIQYQLNSVLSLLQDKFNVDSDSKEVAQ